VAEAISNIRVSMPFYVQKKLYIFIRNGTRWFFYLALTINRKKKSLYVKHVALPQIRALRMICER